MTAILRMNQTSRLSGCPSCSSYEIGSWFFVIRCWFSVGLSVTTSQLVVFRARFLWCIPVSPFVSTQQGDIGALANISLLTARDAMLWLF